MAALARVAARLQPRFGGRLVLRPATFRDLATVAPAAGFDAVDAGTLAEGGRKHQPGTDVYAKDLRTEELRAALGV